MHCCERVLHPMMIICMESPDGPWSALATGACGGCLGEHRQWRVQTADMAGEAARTAWCLPRPPWITYDL